MIPEAKEVSRNEEFRCPVWIDAICIVMIKIQIDTAGEPLNLLMMRDEKTSKNVPQATTQDFQYKIGFSCKK